MNGAIGIHANRIKSGEKMWLSWCIKIKSVTFLYKTKMNISAKGN